MLFIFKSTRAMGASSHIGDYYKKIVFKIITHAVCLALECNVNVLITIDFYQCLAQITHRIKMNMDFTTK